MGISLISLILHLTQKKAKTIEQCLEFVGKTRHTLDRFIGIYYLFMAYVKAYEMVGNMYTVLTILIIQISLMVNTSINIKGYQNKMLNAYIFFV